MPKLSRERLDDRRQHILRAATVCFARDGFHRTTIADVRREADVSTGAIYTYFANKEAIIRAILEQARRERGAQLGTSTSTSTSTTTATAGAGDAVPQALVLLDWVRAIFGPQGRHAARVDVNLWAEAVRNPRVAKIAQTALDEAARAVRPVVAKRMPASASNGARSSTASEIDAVAAVLIAIFLGLEVQVAVGLPLDANTIVRVLATLFGTQIEREPKQQKARTRKVRMARASR
jgi:TetR/AcrR family transcriptional regulator, transcriptional repressor of aconitase